MGQAEFEAIELRNLITPDGAKISGRRAERIAALLERLSALLLHHAPGSLPWHDCPACEELRTLLGIEKTKGD